MTNAEEQNGLPQEEPLEIDKIQVQITTKLNEGVKKTELELNILSKATKKLSKNLQRRFQGLIQEDNLHQNKMASNELKTQKEIW